MIDATLLESLAALFSVINVALLARRSVWNFAFGLVAVALYAFVFLDARLYAVAGLQMVFLAAQIAGVIAWRRAPASAGEMAVRPLPRRHWLGVIGIGLGSSAILTVILRHTDAAAPMMDGYIAGFSLMAQGLTNGRYTQSWPLWTAINAASIALYAGQSLWFTAALSVILLVIALVGWRQWARHVPTTVP